MPGFETLLRDWMVAHPGVPEELDTLKCDRKTLRGSIHENVSGADRFIAQVSPYSQSLGVAIAQTTNATDASGEIQALSQLLEAIELEGGAGVGGRAACQLPFSLYLAQRGPDFLIAVKHGHRRGFRLIRDQLTYGGHIPSQTSKREIKRGRDIT